MIFFASCCILKLVHVVHISKTEFGEGIFHTPKEKVSEESLIFKLQTQLGLLQVFEIKLL